MISSEPNYLPKAPSPNTVTVFGFGFQCMNFGLRRWETIQFIAVSIRLIYVLIHNSNALSYLTELIKIFVVI